MVAGVVSAEFVVFLRRFAFLFDETGVVAEFLSTSSVSMGLVLSRGGEESIVCYYGGEVFIMERRFIYVLQMMLEGVHMYSLQDYIRASPVHSTGVHSIYEVYTITNRYEVSLKKHVEFNHYFANIAKVAKLYLWLRS